MKAIIYLCLEAGLWIALFIMIFLVLRKMNRAKKSQDEIIKNIRNSASNDWFRVNIARPSYFYKKLKLIGFESRGILINYPDSIRIIGQFPSGKWLDKRYPKNNLDLQWVGNKGLSSSNMHWISIDYIKDNVGKKFMLSADTGINALQSREATADICRRIHENFSLPEVAKSEFAIEKNPVSIVVVALFFILITFAIVDGVFINKNQLLEYGIFGKLQILNLLFAIPAYLALSRAKIPSRESLALSLLFATGCICAYLPAIQRIDQIGSTPQSIAYRLEGNAVLKPVIPGSPKLIFSNTFEYWNQFQEGSIHHFSMTHGSLGLWQLDRTHLNQEMRQFYEKQKEK